MNHIKYCLKKEDGHPILFMYPPGQKTGFVDCFSFRDGHGSATMSYMNTLASASAKEESDFFDRYESYCNSLPKEKILPINSDNEKYIAKEAKTVTESKFRM